MTDIWGNGHDYDSHTVADPRDAEIARLTRERDSWRVTYDERSTLLDALTAEREATLARLVQVEQVLRDVEWGGPERRVAVLDPHGPVTHEVRLCPKCGHLQPHEILASQRWKANYVFGHAPNCTLARALKGGG